MNIHFSSPRSGDPMDFNNKNILAALHVCLSVTGQFYTWSREAEGPEGADRLLAELLMMVAIMFIEPTELF